MDLVTQQIKEQFINLASKVGPSVIMPATVLTVNNDAVHVRFSDGSEIEDARLKSVIKDGNHLLFIPSTNSTVLVARIDNSDEYVIVAVDEIKEIKSQLNDVLLSINADGFLLKKENASLKELIKLIIEAVQAIVVLQGTNPDQMKLQQTLSMVDKILR
jgi:hypothetical protein